MRKQSWGCTPDQKAAACEDMAERYWRTWESAAREAIKAVFLDGPDSQHVTMLIQLQDEERKAMHYIEAVETARAVHEAIGKPILWGSHQWT